jgi:NADH-quinone oxidoreductase subunit C
MVSELKSSFGEAILQAMSYLDQNYLVIDQKVSHELIRALRDRFGFNMLTDVTAVHYPKDEKPFEMVWILYCMAREERLRIKARFAEADPVPSITDLWLGANWLEREVYDMFGLRFAGHPDLRRILMPDDWEGHPLRKDYGMEQQDQAWVQKNLGIESGQ